MIFLVKHRQFCSNYLRSGNSRVFEVADYESQNKKWRIQYGSRLHDVLVNFNNFPLNRLEAVTQRFLRSRITNLKSEFQNSIWRSSTLFFTENFENFENFALIRFGTVTRGFFRSPITNLKSESQNSK